MALCPIAAQTEDNLDEALYCVSQLESAGLLNEFSRFYPHYQLGVEVCRLVIEEAGDGGSNNPSLPNPPFPSPYASSVRYYVNLLSKLLEEQCPNRNDPNLLQAEDECLAALQQAVVECLKNVRQKRLTAGASYYAMDGTIPQICQGRNSPPPVHSSPMPWGFPYQEELYPSQTANPYLMQQQVPILPTQSHEFTVFDTMTHIPPPDLTSCRNSCGYQQPYPTPSAHTAPDSFDLQQQLAVIPEPPPCKQKGIFSTIQVPSYQQSACNAAIKTSLQTSNVPACAHSSSSPTTVKATGLVEDEKCDKIKTFQMTNEVPPITKDSESSKKVVEWLDTLGQTDLSQVGDLEVLNASLQLDSPISDCAQPNLSADPPGSLGIQDGGSGDSDIKESQRVKGTQSEIVMSTLPAIIAPISRKILANLAEILSPAGPPPNLVFDGQVKATANGGSGDNGNGKIMLMPLLSQFAPMALPPPQTVPNTENYSPFLMGFNSLRIGSNQVFDGNRLKAWVMKTAQNSCQGQCEKSRSECEEHTLKYLMGLITSWRSLYTRNDGRLNFLNSNNFINGGSQQNNNY